MRLLGIATLEEVNLFLQNYLPMYNTRFSYLAASPSDLYRPIPKYRFKEDPVKTERAMRNDRTVVHHGKLYQIEERISVRRLSEKKSRR